MEDYTDSKARYDIPENRFGITGLDHAGLASRDPRKAGEFIEDILGGVLLMEAGYSEEDLKLGRHKHNFYLVGSSILQAATQREESAYPSADNINDQPHIAFGMSGEALLKFADHLRAHNIPFNGIRSHRGMSACSIYFRDPEGNNLEISTWDDMPEDKVTMMNVRNGFVDWAALAHSWERLR